jgi:hypothetical protein
VLIAAVDVLHRIVVVLHNMRDVTGTRVIGRMIMVNYYD